MDLGIDNLLNFYRHEQNDEEQQLLQSFVTHTQMHGQIGNPYISSGAGSLIKHFVKDFHQGIRLPARVFMAHREEYYDWVSATLNLSTGLPIFVLVSTGSLILKWKHRLFMDLGNYWVIIVLL